MPMTSTKPAAAVAAAQRAEAATKPATKPAGRPPDRRLRLEDILKLMVADGLVPAADAEQLARSRTQRFETALELIADRKWRSLADPKKVLTLEFLVEWLAGRLKVPYHHIDPLKIDLVAVTQTMSVAYAERYRILPVAVTSSVLTVATSEPFVRGWADELEQILRRSVQLVLANPADIRRYMGEFFTLARSMKKAQETSRGEISLARNFEQLVELGKPRQPRRQRPARRPHRRLAVAIRLRAARIGHPHRTATRSRRGAFSHRRRAAPGLRDPQPGAAGDDQPHQAARRAWRSSRTPATAGRPHQDGVADGRRSRAAPIDDADRVRREGGACASSTPEVLVRDFQELGFSNEDRERWEKMIHAAARHRPGHRADRFGQDDDACTRR